MIEIKLNSGSSPQRLMAYLMAGAVCAAVIISVRGIVSSPQDQYQFKAPPAGPNAWPDPPNPDKIKRLPGALSPVGGGPPQRS
ncbi:MAG: hypothetical protein ABJA67_16605 [Chthonomonadales bacterium]